MHTLIGLIALLMFSHAATWLCARWWERCFGKTARQYREAQDTIRKLMELRK